MSGVQKAHDPGTAAATRMAAQARVERASPGTGPKLLDRMREVLRSQTEGRRLVSMPDPRDPESETNFFLKINGAQATFIKNDQGEVTAITRHWAGLPDSEGKRFEGK